MSKTVKRANGQGSVYKLKNGHWRAAVTLGYKIDENGKKKRIVKTKTGFTKKSDALAYLAELKKQPIGVNMGITFKGLYELWSASHYERVSSDTSNGYKAAYKHCENLYNVPFVELKTADLQAVIDRCEKGRRTKADIKSLFTNMYKYAIENDYLNKNYAEYIKLPPKEKSKHDAFTTAERDALWQDYNDTHDLFTAQILMMIYMGLRFGEFKTITKSNIHLKERYIIGGIKTNAGRNRTIPIAEIIYPLVEMNYYLSGDKLLTVHEKVWYHNYRAVLQRAGCRLLDAHCCRHTCATALAEAGIAPAVIKAILGHEDYSTTLLYTHISKEELIKAANMQYAPSSNAE
jgi:integrase